MGKIFVKNIKKFYYVFRSIYLLLSLFDRAGLVSQSIALDLTKYLENEQDYSPWYTALDGLNYLKKRLQNTPAYDLMKVLL